MMPSELERLCDELQQVEDEEEDFLPAYGYSSKNEIIKIIKSDIDNLRCEDTFDYTDEELEEERTSLCISQGIARYC